MNEFVHSGCFAAADTNFAVSGRYIAGTAATQANYVVPVSKLDFAMLSINQWVKSYKFYLPENSAKKSYIST